ncbi:ABC transporter permease [Dyella soli]|uniref:Transport permease protein n=1 Tax=Dyella soli TaxID=522319 RepID=A0A4R0YPW4_9GAMM|nr:ABC transporter permease [Dyella soli]
MDADHTIIWSTGDGRMSWRCELGAYVAEARSECLRYFRAPGFMLPVMLFPTMFYLLFGIVMNHGGNADTARYLLASYGVFGVMSPGLFGFGVSIAAERDNGLLMLKRALPMPAGAYLLGKMLMAMLAAAGVVAGLLVMAVGLAHVSISVAQAGLLLLTGMLGVLPFCAMGMFVGVLVKGQGAPGVLNLIYLPMSFLSGLWIPLPMLPTVLQKIAPLWPSAHLQPLALAALGLARVAVWPHVLVLAGYTIAFCLLAARRLRRVG